MDAASNGPQEGEAGVDLVRLRGLPWNRDLEMTMPTHNISDTDLALAAAMQKALLTGETPHCTCGKMFVKNRMSAQVGGDFYHFSELGQDQVALAIGDVMGHGTSAALLMTFILGQLRANETDQRRPARMVNAINNQLLRLGALVDLPIICTMIYAVVDLPSGIVLYVNVGHPRPIVCNRRHHHLRVLPPTTMVLGVEELDIEESCHQFMANDRLVLFTDGVSETRGDDNVWYSEERLQKFVGAHHNAPDKQLADALFVELDEFSGDTPQDDDQTLVIIDFDNVSSEL